MKKKSKSIPPLLSCSNDILRRAVVAIRDSRGEVNTQTQLVLSLRNNLQKQLNNRINTLNQVCGAVIPQIRIELLPNPADIAESGDLRIIVSTNAAASYIITAEYFDSAKISHIVEVDLVHYEATVRAKQNVNAVYGYAVVSLLKGETDYGKMTIGSVARCVCCGGEQKDHRSIRCAECGSMFVCKGCGKTVHGYGRYIDNHFYCKECSYRCTACGEEFIGMPRIGITRSGEQRGICPACYEQVISVCRNCAIHKRLPSHRCQSFLPKSDERPCRIKEESMQELTFETILRLPQMELKKTLKAELKSRGYPITDKPGYLYAEGTIPVLLVAHMDTVHRQPVEQICYSADGAVAMSPQGIGGDDRCGVWMILQILRTTNCHVLFCEDEEVGCIGAKKFTGGSLRPQVNYIVELDRRGNNDAVFYRCDNPEFEDFVTSFGFETAGGSCSDISYIAPYLETAAVNISCGYYCEHQRHEYIHLEEIELNADRVAQMVTQQTEHFEYMEQQDSFFGGRALTLFRLV